MIKDEELLNTVGGSTILTSAYLNSITKLISIMLDIGRAIGSSIKYAQNKTTPCK